MPISLGGKSIGASTKTPEQMSHDVYLAWDSYIGMQISRALAINDWSRREWLADKVMANPDHPSNAEANRRIAVLDDRIINNQKAFIDHERTADACWRHIPRPDRERESLHEMFGHDPKDDSILGLWHRKLGSFDPAPLEFKMNPVVLQFVPPSHAAVYQKGYQ